MLYGWLYEGLYEGPMKGSIKAQHSPGNGVMAQARLSMNIKGSMKALISPWPVTPLQHILLGHTFKALSRPS